MTDVYFDGHLLGEHDDPEELRDQLIQQRRDGNIDKEVNVSYDDDKDEMHVMTDKGRARHPLAVVEDGEVLLTEEHVQRLNNRELTLQDLIDEGVIEYLDGEEEENALVAMDRDDVTEDHTHMELDPAVNIGVSASTVVYPHHNRGDRVNYGAKMAGQGIGLSTKNFHARYDTKSNLLNYPQQPIVETRSYERMVGEHPIGQNMVIAISSFEGYNIEDAVIFNESSIDRGLARSHHFETYKTESRRYWGGQKDSIQIPDKDTRGYKSEEEYAKLDEDGIVNPETYVEEGDVIVGKTSPPKFLGSSEEVKMGLAADRETSKTISHGEAGTIDKVMITETEEGNKLIKVKMRTQRVPELGDKFATRHGQKGVIGLIVPDRDMPFTSSGITPDIVLSTHAIPSRMTVSQLIEIIGGKAAAMRGEKADGTVFHSEEEEDLRTVLKKAGFRYDGKERMYDGVTGEQKDAEIFIGPGYYLKLSHMVEDKIHARSRGPVTLLTKQPTAGRAREGGLRLGEMEKDVLVGHGSAMLLKERFGSDNVTTYVNKDTGEFGYYDYDEDTVKNPDGTDGEFEEVRLPQAFLLLMNELKSLRIDPTLEVEEDR